MHEEKVELGSVVDEESLVAGRHHVTGLLVGTVTDLDKETSVSVLLFLCLFRKSDPASISCHPVVDSSPP